MQVTYSSLCDVSLVAYLAYLSSITSRNVADLLGPSCVLLDGRSDRLVRDHLGSSVRFLPEEQAARFEKVGALLSDGGGVESSGVVGDSAGVAGEGDVGGESDGGAGVSGMTRGRHWRSNRRKKDVKKARRMAGSSWRCSAPLGGAGSVETVVSSGSSGGKRDELSAERGARESLARRREAENAFAEKLAKLKLASLHDEEICQEYAGLKKQRLIQWRNESIAKSQASLDKCKAIDPGSSVSQYEVRQQAKELSDSKAYGSALFSAVVSECGLERALELEKYAKGPGTATIDMIESMAESGEPTDYGAYVDGY